MFAMKVEKKLESRKHSKLKMEVTYGLSIDNAMLTDCHIEIGVGRTKKFAFHDDN